MLDVFHQRLFLHAAKILDDSKEAEVSGIVFKEPEINLSKMKEWKNNIIGGLTGGLSGLAKQRGVDVIHGTAKFSSKNEIEVNHESDSQEEFHLINLLLLLDQSLLS